MLLLRHQPTPSITARVALLAVASHVRSKLVPGFVVCLHLVANPLGTVALPLLVPKALVFLDVEMRFAMLEGFAVGTGVVCVAGMTAGSSGVAACALLIVVCSGAAVPAAGAAAAGFVGGGVTVRVDGRGIFAGVHFGFDGLVLEELG